MAKQKTYLRGTGAHRRTEGDYMGVLLDTVSLADWQDVVNGALQLAKQGDPQARAWLAQYLVGKPEGKAPTPLTVVVNQWAGHDPLTEKLAAPLINRAQNPFLYGDNELAESLRGAIAAELAQKIPAPETAEKPATAGDSSTSAAMTPSKLSK